MRKRVFFTIIWIALYFCFVFAIQSMRSIVRSEIAAGQLSSNSDVASEAARSIVQSDAISGVIHMGFFLTLAFTWFRPVYLFFKNRKSLVAILIGLLLLTGCGSKTDIVNVGANQTAFLIPIAGNSGQQQQLQSVDFLKKNQVAVKQVIIPYTWKQTGGLLMFPTGDFFADDKLILVDRSLITREWTKASDTGTTATDQAFGVESAESIDFKIGAACTAIIDEADAATYLYYYGEKPLSEVMDTNVRGFVQAQLFSEFGSRTLAQGQADKKVIFDTVAAKVVANFKTQGITVMTFGGSEGMTYSDPKIQDAINASYAAQQAVFQAQAGATKQAFTNQQMVSAANAAATATVIAGAAQAAVMKQSGEMLNTYPGLIGYTIAQKSTGQVPQILVLGSGQSGATLPFTVMIPSDVTPAPAPKP